MKSKLTVLLIMLSLFTYAQKDPCKEIKTEVKELEEITTYTTQLGAMISSAKGYVVATRIINKSKETDQTGLYLYVYGQSSNYDATGVYIKLKDGTIMKEENISVSCRYVSQGRYIYTGIYLLEEENLKLSQSNPIVMISIGGIEKKIDGKDSEKLMAQLNCISDKKS